MTILYTLIGWPCFVGLGVMIIAAPIQGIIMKKLFGLNRGMVKHTDDRVKMVNEAIQGIRCVKMYTWEESFQNVIAQSRNEELDILRRMTYLRGASRAYMGALPGFVAVVSFIVYAVASDGNINASTLFAALVAFGQLRFPLLFYPMSLAQYAQASVSAKRIEAFLKLNEVRNDKEVYDRDSEDLSTGEVVINNATIYWGDPNVPIPVTDDSSHSSIGSSANSKTGRRKSNQDDYNVIAEEEPEMRYCKPIVNDVNVNIYQGELLAIIGRVGSGKSTLCSSILNEAVIGNGSIALKGTVAYAAQSAWILNATLRDNILFGKDFNQEKYDAIIDACQLTHDIGLLEFGDMTEIGENGINLSGGQRQRVSIARAAYSDADIIVLDDPLSALDPEVGRKLFDACIVGLMKEKTRILVTNQLQFLRFCDSIVALDHGRVSEQGTFEEISKNDGEVARLLQELKQNGKKSKSSADSNEENTTATETKDIQSKYTSVQKEKKDGKGGLVTEEERNLGAVSLKVYLNYIRAGGGYLIFLLAFMMFILCAGNDLVNSLWITLWTSDASYERHPQHFYLGFYALTCFTSGIFVFLRSMFLARFGVRASNELHRGLLASILRAPMSFFDTTPTGRILSRFSKDLYSIDLEITDNMDFAIFAGITVIVSLCTMMVVTPWFGVAIVPIMYIYIKTLNYFREVTRETKRLESISRSPVFAHFSETLGGLDTIIAYNQASRFVDNFEVKIDSNTQATYNNRTADRWLSVRLELLGSFIAGLAAVFACSVVINNTVSGAGSSSNFASVAGLSLNYAISFTGLLNWVVRSFAMMEASMNATERVLYYSEEIPQEAPSRIEEGVVKIPKDWPSSGNIKLNNLKMRYRPENPLVIKGLNVKIDGGSRIGVVGRTGSGKSSLLLSLLRIVEPTIEKLDEYEPPISIDGVDILQIGLTDLRGAIGIIPQSPVLFSGSIRSNIDPFNNYTDSDIWNALERCGMKSTIEAMPSLLDAPVAEFGDNLSQGQRQLLCLGRALLKKCRILLLDEATSSVDYKTDKEIQRTLREAFTGCTVLTIAHRVNTIMDSDKILVMVDGKVGEFGKPTDLLANDNSIFADIVKHSHAEGSH